MTDLSTWIPAIMVLAVITVLFMWFIRTIEKRNR